MKRATIGSKYEDLEFGERVTQIYAESDEIYNGYFDFSLPPGRDQRGHAFLGWAGGVRRVDSAGTARCCRVIHWPGDLFESCAARADQGAGEPCASG